ncbi:MAG: hypothetical protein K2M11_07065 [Paramuribaculum sp.]|nr:hypothetical protein [Paramuribaculum sp.]
MKNFTFAMKWHEILKPYSEEIRREVYDAVIEYAASGNVIEMQPLARMAFDFIRYEIDEKARRREARLAKKPAKKTKSTKPTAKQQAPEALPEKENHHPEAVEELFSGEHKPDPVAVKLKFNVLEISKDRIRAIAQDIVNDWHAQGKTPENDNHYMVRLRRELNDRCNRIREQLAQMPPKHDIAEAEWRELLARTA